MRRIACIAIACILGFTTRPQAAEQVVFNRDIRPILSDNCFKCHGPDSNHREAGLRLDLEEAVFDQRDGAGAAVAPGKPEDSLLWQRVSSSDDSVVMPPDDSPKKLTNDQIALLKRWIEQGARWQRHWSFVPPKAPELPATDRRWGHNAIDAFTLARMREAGLEPSPEADRETLLRRVTFDLTGLPPTLNEIDEFLNDESPDAYEKVVDRLLASPHYGERMAVMWLDAARYGDTSVFHADGPRDMWAWRDWVIRAYNKNKPFSEFTIEQLAGDLIPEATPHQKIASAFNRNHGTTDEGGAISEEYRVEYVVDRVKTTSMVWLGMTLECGQCHEHKYDPFEQREYYELFAFFNQTTDAGMQTRRGNAAPTVDVPNIEGQREARALEPQVAKLEDALKQRAAEAKCDFEAWLAKAASEAAKEGAVPDDALVHFPFDERSGKSVGSIVASKQQGTIQGKPLWVDGKHGGALRFDGSNWADAGDVGDFERTDAFSFGAWVYVESDSAGAPIARMNDRNAYRGWDLYVAGGRVAAHIIHRWPDNAVKVTTEKPIEKNKWHHLFVTYDGSSQAAGIKIYVDGAEQKWNIEQNGLTDTIKAKVPLYVGSRKPGSRFKGIVDDVRLYDRKLSAAEVAALAGSDPIKPLLAIAPEKRTPAQVNTLREYFLNNKDETYRKTSKELSALKARIAELKKPLSTVMVMQEMPTPRKTYILERGHYASPKKDEVITPDTPDFLPPMDDDLPKNRLGLAKWLVDGDNPLTARVAVNRYWQMLFGTGIVSTSNDFGSQGQWPSHPELLDYLAVDFVNSGWDVKRMIKQMVMSATYRQSSTITKQKYAADPQNTWLARGPRFRLQGEFIRDNALAVSGLLVPKLGGPGVKPYQPPGLWNEVSLSGNLRFVQDKGEKLYRRSLYTYWKRSAPAPSMRIFDAPTREKCVIKRQRTNTPLQALVTLNDTQFVEAARFFAERMLREGGESPQDRVNFAYRLATGRRPSEKAADVLTDAYQRELDVFQKNPDRAKALLAVGDGTRDESLDAAQHAAWTVVASMILNLDATLTKD